MTVIKVTPAQGTKLQKGCEHLGAWNGAGNTRVAARLSRRLCVAGSCAVSWTERTFLMSTPRADLHRGSRPVTSRRKPGRPFKSNPGKPAADAQAIAEPTVDASAARTMAGLPPAIPYRSFKVALSAFKGQAIPQRLDRSAWSNKLYATNVREIIEAFRFLGLIDSTASPTPAFATLLASFNERSWSHALRQVLERSYHHLLTGDVATLKVGGLLRAFRAIYGVQVEDTRRRCNFFMHAAREAALDTGAHLLVNAQAPLAEERPSRNPTGAVAPRPSGPENAEHPDEIVRDLLLKLPAYDTGWSDEIKRLWFGAYHELVQRLNS